MAEYKYHLWLKGNTSATLISNQRLHEGQIVQAQTYNENGEKISVTGKIEEILAEEVLCDD